MATRDKPPLNGRNVAEFALSRPSAQRTALRRYARPPEEQRPPILMYDPIRKVLAEYYRSGRDSMVLDRVAALLDAPSAAKPAFVAQRRKSNRAAIAHLRDLNIEGSFEEIEVRRTDITVDRVRIKSTADFYAIFRPANKRMKPRRVAAIYNLSGIDKAASGDRLRWMQIEAEFVFRASSAHGIDLDEVFYIDVRREERHVFSKPSSGLWKDLEAICERIYREWLEIRLEQTSRGAAQA